MSSNVLVTPGSNTLIMVDFRTRIGILTSCITLCTTLHSVGQVLIEDQGRYTQYIQEFFFTEAVYSQEKNELQFTLSDYYQDQNQLQLQIEYGFTDQLQIEVELSNVTQKNSESFSGGIGLLYNVLNNKNTALSVATEAGFEEELNEELVKETHMEWGSRIILSKPLGFLQIHAHVGIEISESTQWIYNTGVIAPINNFKGILELNGSVAQNTTWQMTPGLIWNGWKRSELALGVPIYLHPVNNKAGFVIKLTIEFGGDND